MPTRFFAEHPLVIFYGPIELHFSVLRIAVDVLGQIHLGHGLPRQPLVV